MRGARVAALLAVLAAPSAASAWHTGSTFGDAPGAGGGGGVFYVGAPTERGWTCAACHVEAPQQLQVSVTDDGGAFETGMYAPDQEYRVTVRIENEALGTASARSNFNGMALVVQADDPAAPAGTLRAGQGFFLLGQRTLATDSTTVGETSWTFTWTAPASGTGRVTFYLGVVDGNAAGTTGDVTRTDPFGDDVATGALALEEDTRAAARWRPGAERWARSWSLPLAWRRRRG